MKYGLLAPIIAGILNAILSFVIAKPAQLLVGLGKAFVFGFIITAVSMWLAGMWSKK